MTEQMKLYSYFRSSAAYRVRIALNYKQLPVETIPVHLVKDGGQQYLDSYTTHNPQALLPTLTVDGYDLNQSLAILEYLEDVSPAYPLLPAKPLDRATVRAMALHVACDIHPLNNLRVLTYLKQTLDITDEEKKSWYQHWIISGFDAFEKRLEKVAGHYCFQDAISFADVCLIPQVYNAIRFECDLTAFPLIEAIYQRCLKQACFFDAAPEQQSDAPSK